jgi:RHS repeat-associated protein
MRLLKLFTLVLLFNVSLHAIVGATKGNVDVAQGNLTYNVDVLLPKGISGLKPGLKLSYNSSNSTNSVLGVGFSLEGVSLVSKCNETLFAEKQDNSRTYNYCLDGQKLLLTDEASTYGENNTQYRTKTNSQNKVLKTAQGWMVYSKDGLIKEYGYTADSKDGEAFYRINKIKDRYDNEINFTYASTNNEKQLSKIEYANNRIDLVYEDRDDKRMVGSYGQLSNINKRLKQIKVNSNDTLVSSYDVTYEYSHHKSRVKAITECVMGQCLEPVVFDWSEEHIGFSEYQNWGQNAGTNAHYRPSYADSNQYSVFLDINGDGLPDKVHYYNPHNSQYGYWVQLNQYRPSKVISINNSKDQTVNIEYSTLRDSDIYTAHTDASYPSLDIKASAMSVVKALKVIDGNGEENSTTFKYEGLKVDRERGSLGFAKVYTNNDIAKTKTITTFSQEYPFVGVVLNSKSYINDVLTSEQKTEGLNVKKYFTNENILNLEIEKNITHKYDLDGTHLLTSISKNMQYDKYGNVQVVQSITQNADGSEVYTKTTGSVYENNEDKWILGRLISAQVTHEGTGLANVVKSSAFVYDNEKGTLVSEVIEPNSDKQLIKQYEYDSFGNKIKESISGNNITPRSTKYLYDKQGINLVRIENALGHIESREYDIHNRVVKVTGPNNLSTQYTYDAMGRKIKEERADGTMSIWTHSWDNSLEHAMYKVTKQSTGTPPSSIYFDRANRKIRTEKVGFDGAKIYENFYYNALGQQYKSSTPHYDIDAPEYIYTTYDLSGRPLSIDKPGASGGRVTYGFEYNGLTVTETKPNGQTKITKNNVLGQKVQVTESGSVIKYEYDAFGNLIKTIDSQNNIIALTYDIYGNKVSMDDPDMGVWNYTYNALKELVSQTDAKGQTTTMQYDALGRMVQRTEVEGITYWKYDTHKYGIGKLSYVQNDNYKKEFYYGEYGRINNTKEYIEEQVYNTYLSYTVDGKLETTTSPDGFETINEYNEFGFLQAVKTPKVFDATLSYEEIQAAIAENLKISMEYAKEAVQYSNDAQEKKAKSNLFLALAQETSDADIKAQLLSTSSLASQTATLLKTASNDAQEESTRALNRVNVFLKMAQKYKKIEFYDYVASKFREQTRFYIDMALTNLNNAIDGLGKVTTDSSLLGAYLTQEKERIDAHIEQTQRILVSAQGLSQKVVNYKVKHVEAVAQDATQQNSTYLSMVEDENYTYFYKILKADEFGRVTKDIVGNGLISQREYNKANGHLNFITTGYNGDNDIRDIEYEFDVMNNVTLKADKKQNITSNYTYDSLDRIKSANIISSESSMNITYAYDALGNITNKSDVGDYTYSNAHRLTAAGQYAYTYDANGNVIAKNDTTLTYSSYNKPIQIEDGSNTTEFLYAPNRARYKKVHNNDVTYYVGKLFEKEIINGKVRYKNFVYAGGNVVAIDIQEDDGALFIPSVRYLHKDALGSIDTITDESGKVVQRLSYKPFGERIVGSWQNELSGSNALTKRGFTGHEHIDEFNLIHMNGRVYDPVTGRFLSADPHIQAPYDTQSYNRYAYVKNNPLKYTDPSGFFFKKIKRFFKKVGKFFKRVVKTIKKYIRTIVAVVVAIVITVYTAGAAAGWVASWGSAFGTAATATAAATTTALGSITAGAITGAMAGFASGLIMTGSLKGAMTGALSGAIGGAIGGYYGKSWSLGRVASKAVAGGINSELNGGKFMDGFKMGAVTAAAAYLYAKLSVKYNTNDGKAHMFQNGKSDVGEQLDPAELAKVKNGNFPWKSDQSGFMKFVGKYLPYGDAFAELHDGFYDNNMYAVSNDSLLFKVTNVPSMLIAYPLTVVSAMDSNTSYIYSMDSRNKGSHGSRLLMNEGASYLASGFY